MDNSVKIVALIVSGGFTIMALYLGEREFAYAAGSIFSAIVALPSIGRALSSIFKVY